MDNVVEINNLVKTYENGHIKALNGIDLTIGEGEFVSIIGPSGSGKSTLLNMLGALDLPDSGSINVAGYDLISNKKLNEFRAKKIGFIFQLHNLIPNLSVVENIEIPMFTSKLSNSEMRVKALEIRHHKSHQNYLVVNGKGLLLHVHLQMILQLYWLMNQQDHLIQRQVLKSLSN